MPRISRRILIKTEHYKIFLMRSSLIQSGKCANANAELFAGIFKWPITARDQLTKGYFCRRRLEKWALRARRHIERMEKFKRKHQRRSE